MNISIDRYIGVDVCPLHLQHRHISPIFSAGITCVGAASRLRRHRSARAAAVAAAVAGPVAAMEQLHAALCCQASSRCTHMRLKEVGLKPRWLLGKQKRYSGACLYTSRDSRAS